MPLPIYDGQAKGPNIYGSLMAERLSKAKLSVFRRLSRKKHRIAEGRFLIEGWHLLAESLASKARLLALIYDPSRSLPEGDERTLQLALDKAEAIFLASDDQLRALGETVTNSGVVGVLASLEENWEELSTKLAQIERGCVVALDDVSDPGNCGTIIRSGDWFGAAAILLGEGCPSKENGKALRASMGGVFHLPIVECPSLEDRLVELRESGFKLVAASLDTDAENLGDFDWPDKSLLVVGNEARGVRASILERADLRLTIPKFGKGESLNAAMAASVLLANWRIR